MATSSAGFRAAFDRTKARRQQLAGGVRQLISDLERLPTMKKRAVEVDHEIKVLQEALAVLAQRAMPLPEERAFVRQLQTLEETLGLMK